MLYILACIEIWMYFQTIWFDRKLKLSALQSEKNVCFNDKKSKIPHKKKKI